MESTGLAFDVELDVGRYRLLDRLGAGGMGVVYAAWDPDLGRQVAVKILRPHAHGRATLRARLVREAQALARAADPHVVTVHDVGEDRGRVYLAMEFIEGQTLAQWLEVAPRSLDQILDVLGQAGRGLAAAHAVGLVHRDFKPENVMIGRDGRVRVMDFGLAHDPVPDTIPSTDDMVTTGRSQSDGCLRLTTTDEVVGTPAYMSPEQFLQQPTDARSDVFAFCVVLHEAVFGTGAFAGDDPASRAFAVAQGRRRKFAHRAAAPRWLRRIIDRGLKPRPADRWQSMAELLRALGARGRRRAWIDVVGLSVLGVATVLRLAPGEPTEPKAPPQIVGQAESEPEAVPEIIHAEALTALGNLQHLTGSSQLAQSTLAEAFWLAVAHGRDDLALSTSIQLIEIEANALGNLERATQWGRHAKAALGRRGDSPLDEARLHGSLAAIAFDRHDLHAAGTHLRLALAADARAGSPSPRTRSTLLNRLGLVQRSAGDFDASERSHRKGLQTVRAWLPAGDRAAAAHHIGLGEVAAHRGELDAAELQHRRAREILERDLGPDHPYVGVAVEHLGAVAEARGDLDEALGLYRRAHEIAAAARGEDSRSAANVLRLLARVTHKQGHAERADAIRRRADRILGPQSPS